MTDKMELEILRGKDAEQLLAHPLLREAITLIEQDIVDKWQNSPARDAEGREKLYQNQVLLARLVAQIEQVVKTGQFAQATLA